MKACLVLLLLLPSGLWAAEAVNPWAVRYGTAPASATAAPPVAIPDNSGDQFITWKQVEKAVSTKLTQLGAGDMLEITTEMADGSPKADVARRFHSPLTLEVDDATFDAARKSWDAMIYYYAGGKPLAPQHLKGRFEEQVEVPVLINRLVAGEAITEENIATVTLPRSRVRGNTVLEKSQLIGLSARRGISAERAIRQDELAKPTVVKKGDRLTLRFLSNGLVINAVGEAQQDGGMDDVIRVKNADSAAVLQARVTGPGTAEVDAATALPQRAAPARILPPSQPAAPALPPANTTPLPSPAPALPAALPERTAQ